MANTRRVSQPAATRAQAAWAVAQVVFHGRSLDDVLERARKRLPTAEKALLAELAYGGCRYWYTLDAMVQALLHKPLKKKDGILQCLIGLGLYQMLYMRVPDHAAIGETAGAARLLKREWAVGLVNGILRRAQAAPEQWRSRAQQGLSNPFELPEWLFTRLRQAWPEKISALGQGLLLRPALSLRINRCRMNRRAYAALLARSGLTSRPVSEVESALILDRAVAVEQLPGFARGWVSVQDVGAQLAACFLGVQAGMRVLDACAAPGGKTGHLLEMVDGQLECVALDRDEQRVQKIQDNLTRLGFKAQLYCADARYPESQWAGRPFDRILLDAPCSATGVLRRHPDIKLLRRRADIQRLVHTQAQMLDALWPLLKPKGRLLYATCSILPEENQNQIQAFLQRHSDAKACRLSSPLGEASSGVGVQLLPLSQETDGFYYALLEKQ